MVRHWVRDVLDQALEAHEGEVDSRFCDDLRRIAEIVETHVSYAFRSTELEDLCDGLIEIETLHELSRLLWEAAVIAGFQYSSVFLLRQGNSNPFQTRVCTSLPERWLRRYKEKSYQYVDPTVLRAFNAEEPFHFSEIPAGPPMVDAFWEDAEMHGVGRNGICFPVTLSDESKIGVSFCTSKQLDLATASARRHLSDLAFLSRQAAEAYGYLARANTNSNCQLNAAELRFLYVLMVSDDPQEALQVKSHYGSNRSLQDSICAKLRVRNILQAVAIASVNRWFDDLPYEENEVLHASQSLAGWGLLEGPQEDADEPLQ